MNLAPAVVESIRAELAAVPRGERVREADRLAKIYGCSRTTVYRAAALGATNARRAPRAPGVSRLGPHGDPDRAQALR